MTTAPKTLVFVVPHLRTGGVEQVVVRLANGLDRRRFRPVVVMRDGGGELAATLAGDVVTADLGGRRWSLAIPRLASLLGRYRPALVYSGTNAANLSVLAATRLIGTTGRPRVMISEHTTAKDYLAGAKLAPLRRFAIRRLYPGADCLVAPSAALATEWVRAFGLSRLATAVAPNPVLDPAALAELARNPPAREPGLIVAAGRLVTDKGHDLLIAALAELSADHPAARLVIWGDGPEREALIAQAARCGLGTRVRLAGLTGRLLPELAHAHVFALASRREGFGNVVAEALAAGTPVVASDRPGPRLLLGGGAFGTLVAADNTGVDPGELAAALSTVLARPVPPSGPAAPLPPHLEPCLWPNAARTFEDLCDRLLQTP